MQRQEARRKQAMATITGTGAHEFLDGTGLQDWIYGRGGNDLLVGEGGDDRLFGEAGNDVLRGGLGRDVLYGGAGADVFDYNTAAETRTDVIADFSRAEGDKINLRDIDAKDGWWDDAFVWRGSVTGNGVGWGEVGYEHRDGATYIYGNTDGDTQYEVSIRINGLVDLTASDIVL
jgi:Ca2+-binding RTX toxin-like protein